MNRKRLDKLKYRPRVPLYIALEELDFAWFPHEVEKVRELWGQGKSIRQIAKTVDRDPDEVTVLIMSLAREKQIIKRPGGATGISA